MGNKMILDEKDGMILHYKDGFFSVAYDSCGTRHETEWQRERAAEYLLGFLVELDSFGKSLEKKVF